MNQGSKETTMIDGIKERAVSRKTLMLIASTVLFILGASDGVTMTTDQELLSGVGAASSIVMIGIVDAIKAWKAPSP